MFQVKALHDGPQSVGLRYCSTPISQAQREPLKRFQFQLFSSAVQDCLLKDEIAFVNGRSSGAGRLISGLMKHLDCDCYTLCPITHDQKLRGIVGVADSGRGRERESPKIFYELLKLNGAILLQHALRFQKETRRRKKLRQWKYIANHACDFALTIDERQHILRTIPFHSQSLGNRLDGLRLIDVVTRNFHIELNKQIQNSVRQQQPRICDVQLSFGHEGPRWYLARIEPSTEIDTTFATVYFTDQDPDKILKEQVRELKDSLLKASRLSLLGQMSTEFAHQLNQPLQAILNYSGLIQRRIDKGTATAENVKDSVKKIQASVTHSGEIIQRIRDFVTFRSLKTEEVALKDLLEKAVLMIIPTARGWDADLISPADTPELLVKVDRAQSTHVLVNLTINALEACCESGSERPRVEIYIRENAARQMVSVCVKDNGPGLPTDPNVVFTKFYSSKAEGLGMGLAISREVCETQGGSLTARNNPSGTGCTFVAELPLVESTGSDTAELEIIPSTDGSI